MTTPGETAAPVETSAPPDWATIAQEILCPLCDYNLRGLVEPRCPECGHRSNWNDLLDPVREGHWWLFEHHHGKRIRSFFRTFWESQFPHRFWRSVRPTLIPKPKRLLLYWLTVVFFVVFIPLSFTSFWAGQAYYQVYQNRARVMAGAARIPVQPPLNRYEQATIARARQVGVQKFLDQYMQYPSLYSAMRGGIYAWGIAYEGPNVLLTVAIGYALWPWLTVMALLVFRQTMKQARIKPVHVVRCAIYSADAGVLLAILVAPVLIEQCNSASPNSNALLLVGRLFDPVSLIALAICATILTYRLSIAYRQYLGFPQAVATCALAQCMTLLTLFGLYVWFPLA